MASPGLPAPWAVCLFQQAGAVLVHRQMTAGPETFLQALARSRDKLVVCVECRCTESGLAVVCTHEGMPCGLSHALSMQAIPGGQAQHARLEASKIARRPASLIPAR